MKCGSFAPHIEGCLREMKSRKDLDKNGCFFIRLFSIFLDQMK